MNPWRWPMWIMVALVVAADIVVIAADPATLAPMLAWVLASFVAGMCVGVASMAGLAHRLERERDEANFPPSFMTFGSQTRSAAPGVPGHAPAAGGPYRAILGPNATLLPPLGPVPTRFGAGWAVDWGAADPDDRDDEWSER